MLLRWTICDEHERAALLLFVGAAAAAAAACVRCLQGRDLMIFMRTVFQF
jgi:hypothetical protein